MYETLQRVPGVRITCMVHRLLAARLVETVGTLASAGGWIETARVVRQRIGVRRPLVPTRTVRLDNAPMDLLRLTVPPAAAAEAAATLIEAGQLRTPGRGQLMLQDVELHADAGEIPAHFEPDAAAMASAGLMPGMVLLTCIASQTGSGEHLARIALKLGAGLPVVGRGIGTGMRDRLGLLRITIPPEKEIVRLILPAHDADGIQRLLVEDARLDRPGGGFLFQTGVRECLLDPLLRIGRHGHAASMEQIIAALDDLKGGTAWRKHVAGLGESRAAWSERIRHDFRELTFCCGEGRSEALVREALAAGAGGATIATGRALGADERGDQALESVMLCVPGGRVDAVLNAIHAAASRQHESGFRSETLAAHSVFSYQQRGSG